jgi:hypothetical protein
MSAKERICNRLADACFKSILDFKSSANRSEVDEVFSIFRRRISRIDVGGSVLLSGQKEKLSIDMDMRRREIISYFESTIRPLPDDEPENTIADDESENTIDPSSVTWIRFPTTTLEDT